MWSSRALNTWEGIMSLFVAHADKGFHLGLIKARVYSDRICITETKGEDTFLIPLAILIRI